MKTQLLKFTALLLVLTGIVSSSLQAQITQEQANIIVLQHIQNEVASPCLLYVYTHAPSVEGIVINTHKEENVKVKYACWAYYLNEFPGFTEPCQHRYLFVKEDNGNLLEVITTNDLGVTDLTEWKSVPLGVVDRTENESLLVYPNPTTGELTVEIAGQARNDVWSTEVFDIYGRKCHVSHVTRHENSIDISHLQAGIYFVKITTNVGVQTQKIIKL
jgi:hypothetical protein